MSTPDAKSIRPPYRVAVWGPGSAGLAAVREVILLPEMKLVSVLAYSESKRNVDAGTLAGKDPIGVPIITELSKLLSARPECVIYAARDYGDGRSIEDIVGLLEVGINVITVLAYQYPQLRGDTVVRRIEKAAQKGRATFFATGINPGFMFERLAMVMSGLSNDVRCIRLFEFLNCEHMPGAGTFLQLMGFGMHQVDTETTERTAALVQSYLTQYLYFAAEKLGKRIERVERKEAHANAPEDIVLPGIFTIRKGTVGRVSFGWTAYSDGKPFLVTQSNWYVTEKMRPAQAQGKVNEYWIVEVEGRPSTRVSIEMFGSVDTESSRHTDNASNLAYIGTIVPAIQAIPAVVAAAPGIMSIGAPQFHWKADLRS